jgi:hypothetical protein
VSASSIPGQQDRQEQQHGTQAEKNKDRSKRPGRISRGHVAACAEQFTIAQWLLLIVAVTLCKQEGVPRYGNQ